MSPVLSHLAPWGTLSVTDRTVKDRKWLREGGAGLRRVLCPVAPSSSQYLLISFLTRVILKDPVALSGLLPSLPYLGPVCHLYCLNCRLALGSGE